ncbi:MAG TPA: hypothetical protein VNS12_07420 [Pelagibacterium sp.]|uniref:hypothetical protein n=1 Tax=Pelagibacterium sp. TaxID=1967288 RepID=UPI002C88C67E|nr:hypothetical protein [Pelagibacterium sp.]HWJ87882.1 hypothetical protein [Pelagibacterium sp.]
MSVQTYRCANTEFSPHGDYDVGGFDRIVGDRGGNHEPCRTAGDQHPHVEIQDQKSVVAARDAHDRPLPRPTLILHALQINISAGRLPEPEANGTPSGQNSQ